MKQDCPLAERFDPKVLAELHGLDFKARYVMEGFLNGLHSSPFHGFSVEFSDYRDYQPGDDLRHLDWRLYARNDDLCIKRYMQETNVSFYVLCDASASMNYRGAGAWGAKLECAKILAAALTWFLLKQNDAAGLVTLGGGTGVPEFIPPSQRPNQFGLLLRRLESLRAAGGACLASLLEHTARLVRRRSVILLFSDLLEPSESVALGLKQLRFHGHEVVIFQTLDCDELEFRFAKPMIFADMESGDRREVSPPDVREKYLARFRAFMEAHRELFRQLEMPHCVVRTDQSPWQALAMFMAERKKLK